MKKIFTIIWKDTILRFSSRSELLFFLILPIVFTFILAGGTGIQDADNRIRLLVVDQAQSPLSAQIIAELDKSETVRPDLLALDKAESEFDARNASALLVIPADCDSQTLRTGKIVLDLRQTARQPECPGRPARRAGRPLPAGQRRQHCQGLPSAKPKRSAPSPRMQTGRHILMPRWKALRP